MGVHHPLEVRRRNRFRKVVDGPQLHRLKITVHIMTTCHHQYGEMAVFLDGLFQDATTLEMRASLIHYNEVKALCFQMAQGLFI
jgi:hypothetical protein